MFEPDFVTGSFETLMDQASSTAAIYLQRARGEIDKQFGVGFAEANPTLVAAFMATAASDLAAGMHSKAIGHATERLVNSIDALAGR